MQIRPRLLIHTAAGKSLFSGSIPIRMIELVEASVSELPCCTQESVGFTGMLVKTQKTTNEGSGSTFESRIWKKVNRKTWLAPTSLDGNTNGRHQNVGT